MAVVGTIAYFGVCRGVVVFLFCLAQESVVFGANLQVLLLSFLSAFCLGQGWYVLCRRAPGFCCIEGVFVEGGEGTGGNDCLYIGISVGLAPRV